jgi:hypothetical protein
MPALRGDSRILDNSLRQDLTELVIVLNGRSRFGYRGVASSW